MNIPRIFFVIDIYRPFRVHATFLQYWRCLMDRFSDVCVVESHCKKSGLQACTGVGLI